MNERSDVSQGTRIAQVAPATEHVARATGPSRLRAHDRKMQKAGFRKLRCYVCPELLEAIKRMHVAGESQGQTLERVILGFARTRPHFYTQAEKAERTAAREARQREHLIKKDRCGSRENASSWPRIRSWPG